MMQAGGKSRTQQAGIANGIPIMSRLSVGQQVLLPISGSASPQLSICDNALAMIANS
jgi:hypothetical protein